MFLGWMNRISSQTLYINSTFLLFIYHGHLDWFFFFLPLPTSLSAKYTAHQAQQKTLKL